MILFAVFFYELQDFLFIAFFLIIHNLPFLIR